MLHKTCAQSLDGSIPVEDRALPLGTSLLQGQYQIEKPLLSGGFGITYLARDSLDRRVVIKECFPVGFGFREGTLVRATEPHQAKCFKTVLRHFLREAQWLAKADHPNVVSVHQVFKENGTAYIAMECIEGCDLVSLRDREPERFSPRVLSHLLDQALQGLGSLHQIGMLHRDIAPDNYLLDEQNHLTLIDFGAACGLNREEDTALGALLSVKDGYSPHEFYHTDMPQRAASDLYALGATFYFLVTGTPPPQASKRLDAIAAGYADPCILLSQSTYPYDPSFLASIDKAMSILPGARFQSAEEWHDSLPAMASQPEIKPEEIETPQDAPVWDNVPEALSDLVARTNQDLKKAPQRAVPVSAPDAQKEPRQMVDIFGNPVGDVERWLASQDQAARVNVNAQVDEHRLSPEPVSAISDKGLSAQTPPSGWAERVARIWKQGLSAHEKDLSHDGLIENGKTL